MAGPRRVSEITNQYLINFAGENIILRTNQGHMYQTTKGNADAFVRIDIKAHISYTCCLFNEQWRNFEKESTSFLLEN